VLVRVYTVEAPADARLLGCGQGYYYTVVVYDGGRPAGDRRACEVEVDGVRLGSRLDAYYDAVEVSYRGDVASIVTLRQVLRGGAP